jgi:hypothetical protein
LINDRPLPASLGFTTFREVRQPYERQIFDDSGGSPHLLARFQCLDPGVTTISVVQLAGIGCRRSTWQD